MALETLNQFDVWANSRHPKWRENPPAYDEKISRYDPDYVNPPHWIIGASALNALIGHLKSEDPTITLKPIDPNAFTPLTAEGLLDFIDPTNPDGVGKMPGAEVPEEVVSYDWRIEKNDGSHREDIIKDRSLAIPVQMTVVQFKVPEPGEYTVSLTVRFKAGAGTNRNRKDIELRDFLIVSIGDSMASGEGVPDESGEVGFLTRKRCKDFTTVTMKQVSDGGTIAMEQEAVWQEPKAHRSYLSGASRAALLLERERKNPGDVVTFLSFARSGSKVFDGLIRPKNDTIDKGQIDEIVQTVGNRKIHALVITVGVNDVGFATTLKALVEDDLSIYKVGNDDVNRDELFEEVDRQLTLLPNNYFTLNLVIEDKLPDVGHVLITEYPTSMFDIVNPNGDVSVGPGCGVFDSFLDLDIDILDAAEIRLHAEKLNGVIKKAAEDNDWTLIKGIAGRFAGHGYCSGNSFWVFAEDSCVEQGDFEGIMHPNEKGHTVLAEQIMKRLDQKVLNPIAEQDDSGRQNPGTGGNQKPK